MTSSHRGSDGSRPTSIDDAVLTDASVLIVDDNPQNLVLFERILGTAGVSRIHTTMDPTTAVEVYRSLEPDLVLLDLHMPDLDGVELMRALAGSTPEDDFVPIIVLTADATIEARDRALAAGANDFLTKPVDRVEVLLRARNLLHTRSLHARLARHNAELQAEINQRRQAEEQARADAASKAQRVRDLLDRGGPRIFFQPIAHLKTGSIIGYEALARFDDEPRQRPDRWFAEAAEVGLGIDLELAAVRGAVARLDELPADTFLALNVSPAAAMTANLADELATSPASRLVLEITEHAPVADYHQLDTALIALRSSGVRLAVDDAGAGYASLNHILELQPDIIKLDMTLVRDIDKDPVKRALASALVTFSDEIRATITAEGIETSHEQATLIRLGIPDGQGYHLGRPAPVPTPT